MTIPTITIKCSNCGSDAFPMKDGADCNRLCVDHVKCEERRHAKIRAACKVPFLERNEEEHAEQDAAALELLKQIHTALRVGIAGFAAYIYDEFAHTMQSTPITREVVAFHFRRAAEKYLADPNNPFALPPEKP